ncbi:hypothetical protein C4552_04545 [Candidatus Parcubacteria bacterium]|nr:MAG: hypothetical protein C4552_04545 [Candidatus Parcubacteria bacterium]
MTRAFRTAEAALLLAGTIIGVGMFAIPYVFVRAGFLAAIIELGVLTVVMIAAHRAYADIVTANGATHRLPGYARRYLGATAGGLATVSVIFGIGGTLLAYVILGGSFLGDLLHAFAPFIPASAGPWIFFAAGAAILALGVRYENAANTIMAVVLMLAIAAVVAIMLPSGDIGRLLAFQPARVDIPYGVILFSLAGGAIIPSMRERFRAHEAQSLNRAVVWGTIIPAVLYAAFAAAVVAAVGMDVSTDALGGLSDRFGSLFILLGATIGFLASFTSFIGMGGALEEMFVGDLGIRRRLAWIMTMIIPAVLYFVGSHDFIRIIGLVGAIGIGFDSLLIFLIHARLGDRAKEHRLRLHPSIRVLLIIALAAGALQEAFKIYNGA